MKQIQLYVSAETMQVFLLAFVLTSLIMTLGVGVNEGLRQGLPLTVAVSIMPFVIPESMRMTVPASLLFGVCTVVGRMSADRELTALKSLGIHPMRVCSPILFLGYVLSLTSFLMYEVCAVWGRPGLKSTLISAIDDIAYQALRTERILTSKDLTIFVGNIDGRRLLNPRLEMTNAEGVTTVAEATGATLEVVGNTGILRIKCTGTTFNRQSFAGALPGETTFDIPFRSPLNQDPTRSSPAELRASDLDSQIAFEQEQIEELQAKLIAAEPESRLEQIGAHQRRLWRLQAELPRRMANGFASFAFAIIGIPIAAWSQSKDNMSVFFICVVPIAAVYYPLLVVGEELARGGWWPQGSVWLAPAVLVLVGSCLLIKLFRH